MSAAASAETQRAGAGSGNLPGLDAVSDALKGRLSERVADETDPKLRAQLLEVLGDCPSLEWIWVLGDTGEAVSTGLRVRSVAEVLAADQPPPIAVRVTDPESPMQTVTSYLIPGCTATSQVSSARVNKKVSR